MVLGKSALLEIFVAMGVLAQVQAPFKVTAPATATPACVDLYEQRSNGNQFVALCAPNSVAVSTFAQLPNAASVQLAGTNINGQNFTGTTTFSAAITMAASIIVSGTQNNGSAASPWNDFVTRTSYGEIFKVAHPGTTFGTAWSIQTGATSDLLDIIHPGTASKLTINGSAGGFALTSNNASASFGSAVSPWLVGFFQNVAANSTLHAVSGYDGSVFRYSINNGASGSNVNSAITINNAAGSTIFDVAYGGTTSLVNLSASGNLSMGGLSSSIIPTSDLSYSIGSGSFRIASFTGRTFTSFDGTNNRVQILNPGTAVDTGPALTIRNAAGTALFETRYNTGITTISELAVTGTSTLSGVIATSFTGGANANLCVNTAGLLYRGSPGC